LSSPANNAVSTTFPTVSWNSGGFNWNSFCSLTRYFRLEVIFRVFASLHVR
jgi:hypothetical protein